MHQATVPYETHIYTHAYTPTHSHPHPPMQVRAGSTQSNEGACVPCIPWWGALCQPMACCSKNICITRFKNRFKITHRVTRGDQPSQHVYMQRTNINGLLCVQLSTVLRRSAISFSLYGAGGGKQSEEIRCLRSEIGGEGGQSNALIGPLEGRADASIGPLARCVRKPLRGKNARR